MELKLVRIKLRWYFLMFEGGQIIRYLMLWVNIIWTPELPLSIHNSYFLMIQYYSLLVDILVNIFPSRHFSCMKSQQFHYWYLNYHDIAWIIILFIYRLRSWYFINLVCLYMYSLLGISCITSWKIQLWHDINNVLILDMLEFINIITDIKNFDCLSFSLFI